MDQRRVFERTGVTVQGELLWQIKRRTGLVKTNRVGITTVDLSVDGARITTTKKTRLPVGASVRILIEGESSPARVRASFPDRQNPKKRLVLLQFEDPPAEFLRVVDQWVDAAKGGNDYKAAHWENQQRAAS